MTAYSVLLAEGFPGDHFILSTTQGDGYCFFVTGEETKAQRA